MSHAYRARGAESEQNVAAEQAVAPPDEMLSNELMAALIEQAGVEAGVDEQVDLLALDQEGMYNFPEGGDRVQQQEALPGLREKHAGTEYHDVENSAAFVQGQGDQHAVDPNDVKQGQLGDCYLIAGMIAVARANPELIKKLIKDNGNGTYDVTLYIRPSAYGTPRAVTKTVDARLPSSAPGSPIYAKTGDNEGGQTEIWSALIEKTVAQHKGSYDLISGGNIGTGFQFHGATELLTGRREGYFATAGMQEDDALLHMAVALEELKPVTCDSKDMTNEPELAKEATAVNVYGNHAYCPKAVDLDARTVDLTNPWGSSHVTALPIADFMRFYRAIRVGQ